MSQGMAFGPEPPIACQPRASAWLAAARKKPGHAYLMVGPEGTGQSKAMLWLAAAWNCQAAEELRPCSQCGACTMVLAGSHPDVLHWKLEEGEKTFKVERVRTLQSALSRKTMLGRRQVHLLEDWDAVNTSGANALLKALEEAPEGSTLLLRAKVLGAVLPTIVSRCQVIPFQRASEGAIAQHLKEVLGLDELSALRLAQAAEGLPERAIAWALAKEAGPAPILPAWPPADPVEASSWAELRSGEEAAVQQGVLKAMLMALRKHAMDQESAIEKSWALAKQIEEARMDLAQSAQARLVWERLALWLRQASWTAHQG